MPALDLPAGVGHGERLVPPARRRRVRELTRYRDALLMLIAFLIYNDGIRHDHPHGSVHTASGDRPAGHCADHGVRDGAVRGRSRSRSLFGALAGRIGAKPSVFAALMVYVIISVIGSLHGLGVGVLACCSFLVAMVQGGSQALVAVAVREHDPEAQVVRSFRSSSAFEKFAGVMGPALFAVTVRYTGSSRNAILSVIAFFVIGAILLWRVDVERGQQMAGGAAERGALTATCHVLQCCSAWVPGAALGHRAVHRALS